MNTWSTDGFLMIPGVFSLEEVEGFRAEAGRVAAREGSACVRRLREKSPMFDRLSVSDRIKTLLLDALVPVRSILFDKTPAENWPVAWHQDLSIAVKRQRDVAGYGPWSIKDGVAHVQPPTALLAAMVTVRIHLDNTPASNGALRVMPGSHRAGKLPMRNVPSHVNDEEVICACGAGDVLLMSPLILHASRRAETPKRRRILHFEYAPTKALAPELEWHESPGGAAE